MSVRILHYSDIENAFDNPDRIGRLAGRICDRRDSTTLVCGTGDSLSPGLLSMEMAGEQTLPFFEAISPDYATIGNHDFDHGRERLREIIADSPQQWLVANLYRKDQQFGADVGVQSHAVTEIDGVRLGLIGVTEPTTISNHYCTDPLTVSDPVTAVADTVSQFETDVEYVIVLSHAGPRDDEIADLDGVDLVLGGHDHERRADTISDTPVVHPGERGSHISESKLDSGSIEATLLDVSEHSIAADVAQTYEEIYTELGLTETVTQVAIPITRTREDLYPESVLGNLVADAYRWVANADVAVFHPLMLRTGAPLEGDVSVGDLRSLTPFDNELCTTQIDGDALLELFESIGSPNVLDIGPEVYGHVSGAGLTWRRTDKTIELVDVTVGGNPLGATESYTVVAPEFEFGSDIISNLSRDEITATHGHQQEAVVDYVRAQGIDTTVDERMETVSDTASQSLYSLRDDAGH